MTDNGTGTGLNRRQAIGLAGAATAAVGGALQASPASAASAETSDAAAQRGRPRSGDDGAMEMLTVSLDQAREVIEAAIEYVKDRQDSDPALPPMFVVVVDACGDEKASERMDGNGAASTVLAPIKARTSAAFRRPTAVLAEGVSADPAGVASFTTAGFSLLGGGHPLQQDGMVIGAVGVGGGTPAQDAEVAAAAAAVLDD
jgi:uncharacterized protein GlcG (DUF336 family)